MSGCVSSSMLIGEPSKMDALFLPNSLRPSSLAEELKEDMEMDVVNVAKGDISIATAKHQDQHQHDGTTRILVDALVTTPTATTRWYQASLTSILLTVVILLCLIFGHRYIRIMLLWLQEQDLTVGLFIFTVLFFVISFPIFWGYALLLLAAGYLYGCVSGPLVVITCCGVALTCANFIMRTCCRSWFMEKFYSAKVEAILHVINRGPGFKIVALTRLTPIPFGLQNALFSLSDMNQGGYLLASIAGLSPMAALYCYMGSTLRSMEDVLSDQSNQLTGYCIFGGQMLFTVALLCFVVRKARGELKKAMDQTSNGKTMSNGSVILVEP
ncbi:transmembrane protein 64-like [Littorina saxatilis]|uniref:VTT domain-containing protein n=1 Tax=Littorina saxatilis TaxID=31220 RepID=A0AAN9GNP5_9CAEN